MADTIYKIIDRQTKQQIGKDYNYVNRNRARNRADKLNLEHGCHRYYVKPIFNTKDSDHV